MYYLTSFRPLSATAKGRRAAAQHRLAPYLDASCRREPDFEHASGPTLTALCRPSFAPKLLQGDVVVYLTTKASYAGAPPHRRLVAVLEVARTFPTHREAAAWYGSQALPLPSNCMVTGNTPLPYSYTDNALPEEAWDRHYRVRARQCSVFHVCTALFMDYGEPPVVTDNDLLAAFGRVPGTQNPSRVGVDQLAALLWRVGIAVLPKQEDH